MAPRSPRAGLPACAGSSPPWPCLAVPAAPCTRAAGLSARAGGSPPWPRRRLRARGPARVGGSLPWSCLAASTAEREDKEATTHRHRERGRRRPQRPKIWVVLTSLSSHPKWVLWLPTLLEEFFSLLCILGLGDLLHLLLETACSQRAAHFSKYLVGSGANAGERHCSLGGWRHGLGRSSRGWSLELALDRR